MPCRITGLFGGPATRIVFASVGIVLLTAAGLKGYQLSRSPSATDPLFESRTVAVVSAAWEAVLGGWLLTGAWPALARLTAFGCFVVFAIAAVYLALAGRDSCGCFGLVRVVPWATFGLDIALIGLLAAARPSAQRFQPVSVLAVSVIVVGGGGWLWINRAEAQLDVQPPVVDLGAIVRGQRAVAEVRISNPTADLIEWDRIETSCPCISLRIQANSVDPGGSALAVVIFDSSVEPDYTGDLGVDVKGVGFDGRPVLRFQVRVRVSP